jgi:hypothetical protein
MYSESDIASAVEAGIMPAETAEALRLHVEARRQMPAADEEHFRLLGGFNDVFITLAIGLLLFLPIATGHGFIVAAACWGLAEIVTRRRRLALPSVVLAIAFGVGIFLQVASGMTDDRWSDRESGWAVAGAAAALVTASAAFLYWWRFRVPVSQAVLASAILGLVYFAVRSTLPDSSGWTWLLLGLGGVAIFAYAMWWDLADPERRTQSSDVAFWLHLLSAPLIAHSVFRWVWSFEGSGASWAIAVLFIYAAFTVVALVVDRRAILVSGLGYALVAVAGLLGDIGDGFIPSTLFVGGSLLFLGLFWPKVRSAFVIYLPEAWRRRLPPARR